MYIAFFSVRYATIIFDQGGQWDNLYDIDHLFSSLIGKIMNDFVLMALLPAR